MANFWQMMKNNKEIGAEKEKDDLPPGIEEYSEQNSGNIPISFSDQKELLYSVRAKTGLDITVIGIILKEYYQEIRTELMKNKEVAINGLGKFVLSKKRVKFFPTKDIK